MENPCNMKMLSETANGKMYRCSSCSGNVIFMYHNITLSLNNDHFHKLYSSICMINTDAYFRDFPSETHVHIRTEWKDLIFSFTEEEIRELRLLWQQADFKMKLFERYTLHIN